MKTLFVYFCNGCQTARVAAVEEGAAATLGFNEVCRHCWHIHWFYIDEAGNPVKDGDSVAYKPVAVVGKKILHID